MRETYLEVTFSARPAACYYLPWHVGQKSVRTRRVEPYLIIDYAADGRAIGIEITARDSTVSRMIASGFAGASLASD
jgi:hypothetical protein